MSILSLYLDDSGTKHPDKKRGRVPKHNFDWFSIGGILIDDEKIISFNESHQNFCSNWSIVKPLHSSEIRARAGFFSFIGKLSPTECERFHEELYGLMSQAPVRAVACVIDRPGYRDRYDEKYGAQKWQLCKTAFSIVVERSAKIADKEGKKLRVNIERCDKKTDKNIKSYYGDLKQSGTPFDDDNSSKYNPLSAKSLSDVLYDIKFKYKTSPLTQLADLYLWPICMGGYNKENRPYKRLQDDQKLIDCHLEAEEKEILGIKYSCWELAIKKDKAQ